MTRRCSHCSNNGHNSRTCPIRGGGGGGGGAGGGSGSGSGSGIGGGVKLFGVRLTDGSIMKKSASMGNLSSLQHHSSTTSPAPGSPSSDRANFPDGYLSDDPTHASCSTNRGAAERKKGVPWTEEEHRLFLLGLQKLGKGDWRGISRNFVTSRTPTQVASHAQKYFIRQTNATRRKRRSSLFDMPPDMVGDPPPLLEEQLMLPPPPPLQEEQLMLPPLVDGSDKEQTTLSSSLTVEGENSNVLPSLELSLKPDFESMDITPSEATEETNEIVTPSPEVPPVFPTLLPAYIPLPFSLWPPNGTFVSEDRGAETSQHQILKPVPIVLKESVNADALTSMSRLSLGEAATRFIEPSPLSLKLTGDSSRQSAFHASTPVNGSEIAKGENGPVQAG